MIEDAVAPYGFTRSDILSPRSSRRFSCARQMAYSLAYEATGVSTLHLGRLFGRDHSTILHGIQRHQARKAWAEVLIAMADCGPRQPLFAVAA